MATLNSGVCASVDADAVKEIIDTDLDDERINAFINMAYFATIPLTNKLDDCGGAGALCQIQLWLAAHLLTVFERQLKSKSVGGEWSVTFLGKDGLGLEASLYGQQALALDCSGELAGYGLQRASFQVIDYDKLANLSNDAD